jgi:acetoacetate decarboxylase
MPVRNAISHKGPWYCRGTEMVLVEFGVDPKAALAILPAELEFFEPLSAFMVIERKPRAGGRTLL